MRNARFVLLAAACAVATFVGLPMEPAAAAPVADAGVTAASLPTSVSIGEDVIYRVTVKNNGLLPTIGATVTDTQSGGAFDLARPTPGCSVSGNTATCNAGSLGAGQSVSFDLFVKAPATAGTITNTATVNATFAPPYLDQVASNNSASTPTTVTNPATGVGGFVPPTGTLTFAQSVFSVPAVGTPGVIANLNLPTVAAGTMCGSVECNRTNGLHIGIVQDDFYKALDPNNPLSADVTFGNGDPCRGLGNTCTSLFWRHDAGMTPVLLPYCNGATATSAGPGVADPSPCLNYKYKTTGGEIHYQVKFLSHDPDLLAPIRSVAN